MIRVELTSTEPRSEHANLSARKTAESERGIETNSHACVHSWCENIQRLNLRLFRSNAAVLYFPLKC